MWRAPSPSPSASRARGACRDSRKPATTAASPCPRGWLLPVSGLARSCDARQAPAAREAVPAVWSAPARTATVVATHRCSCFHGGWEGGRDWRHLAGWQPEQLTAFASTNGAHLPSRQRHNSRPCSCHRGWGSLARERSRGLVRWPPVTPTLAVAWNVPASTGATVRGSRASAFGRCNFQHTADQGLEGLEPPRARRSVPDLAPCARVREPRGGAVRAAWCSAGRAAPEAHQRSDKWRRTSRLLGVSWMCAALTG